MYNKIRSCKDNLEKEKQYRSLISDYNKEIKWYRNEIKMCEDLKEKNIPLLDQVIEDNQIGDIKVKKKDLKEVFDYFKKD